jgi:hypothetical protein
VEGEGLRVADIEAEGGLDGETDADGDGDELGLGITHTTCTGILLSALYPLPSWK